MFMIWETFWRHKRSKNKFRRLVCLSANFEMHNLASFFWWVFYFSLIWEHLDPFKKNKRVSLIKKMVLKHLGDEIWPTLCPVKGSIENRGFRFLRFLLFPVSPVSGFEQIFCLGVRLPDRTRAYPICHASRTSPKSWTSIERSTKSNKMIRKSRKRNQTKDRKIKDKRGGDPRGPKQWKSKEHNWKQRKRKGWRSKFSPPGAPLFLSFVFNCVL